MSVDDSERGALPQPGDVVSDRYVIEAIIGRGGFGAVFRGRNTATDRPIAIKWLLPQVAMNAEAMARFLAEAKVTGRIEHPNVVSIFDVGRDQKSGAPFIIMELLRGESLRERLAKVGRCSPGQAISLLLPAMRGVLAAHREGVVHRDLKPDNIFLCEDKEGHSLPAKVVDFGISKLFEGERGSGASAHLTRTGTTIGTPAYMAPEQLNAPKKADVRFDVYAMGVVLYEVLTGRAPYRAEGLLELIQLIAVGSPTAPRSLAPSVSPALESVVLRAMHRDMGQRIASIQDLISELEALRDAGALEARIEALGATLPSDGAPREITGTLEIDSSPRDTSSPVSPRPVPATTPLPTTPGAFSPTTPLGVVSSSTAVLAGNEMPSVAPVEASSPSTTASGGVIAAAAMAALALLGLLAAGLVFAFESADEEPAPAQAVVTHQVLEEPPTTPEEPAQDSPPAETAELPLEVPIPAAAGPLTYRDIREGEHVGEEIELSGQVYGRQTTAGRADFQLAVANCAPACVLWIEVGENPPPLLGARVRVGGTILEPRNFRSRAGEDATMPCVRLNMMEPLPGEPADAPSMPDRLTVEIAPAPTSARRRAQPNRQRAANPWAVPARPRVAPAPLPASSPASTVTAPPRAVGSNGAFRID